MASKLVGSIRDRLEWECNALTSALGDITLLSLCGMDSEPEGETEPMPIEPEPPSAAVALL
jgi:hypothetical protein